MPKTPLAIKLNEKWCKGCGICIAFCPAKVFDTREDGKAVVAHPEACIGCGLCELRCPDFAISLGGKGHGE
ncbi:MAG TPA: 4Fe-4S binding protein [Firmicutes bacterium]|nr:4Fe-4S binding protein [Bacillota bacterium]